MTHFFSEDLKAIKRKKVSEKLKTSGWKLKSCRKILNPAGERKQLFQILNPAVF